MSTKQRRKNNARQTDGFSRYRANQNETARKVLEFSDSLATYRDNPTPYLGGVTEELAYLGRNERANTGAGDDPFYEVQNIFERQHIRMPYDKRSQVLGLAADQNFYETNPIAGTGNGDDNLQMLVGINPIEDDDSSRFIAGVQAGLAFRKNTADLLDADPTRQFQTRDAAGNDITYADDNRLRGRTDLNAVNQPEIIPNNSITRSLGRQAMMDEKSQNYPLYTKDNVTIPYLVNDKEIIEADPDLDPLDTQSFVKDHKIDEVYFATFGFIPPGTSVVKSKATEQEILAEGNPFIALLSGADIYAKSVSFKHKGIYPDVEDTNADDLTYTTRNFSHLNQLEDDIAMQERDVALMQ